MALSSAVNQGYNAPAEAAPASATVQRLVAKCRYEPPKIVSFPIDSMRVPEPVTLAGNC